MVKRLHNYLSFLVSEEMLCMLYVCCVVCWGVMLIVGVRSEMAVEVACEDLVMEGLVLRAPMRIDMIR